MSRTGAARRGLPAGGSAVGPPTDKRFRRPDTRPGRRPWRKFAWRAGLVGAAALVVLAGLVMLGSVIAHAPAFAVDHVVVRGNTRLSSGEVDGLLDGLRGQSILLVDFDEYRARLMDSPWVGSVTLSRMLPSTVTVRITERVPMVVARLGQQLYLVDEAGAIIDEFGPQYRDFDLPLVDGLVRQPKTGDAVADPDGVRVTGRFLNAVAAQPTLRRLVSQIDVANPRDVVVLLNDDPALLHVGDTRFVERLNTYLQVASALQGQLKDLDYVDLRFDDHYFVRSRVGGQ